MHHTRGWLPGIKGRNFPCDYFGWQNGKLYYLGGDTTIGTSNCFVIAADNVTFDCRNHSIITSGVVVPVMHLNGSNTTIKNCNFTMDPSLGSLAIRVVSSNNRILNNTFGGDGLSIEVIDGAANNTIQNNNSCGSTGANDIIIGNNQQNQASTGNKCEPITNCTEAYTPNVVCPCSSCS